MAKNKNNLIVCFSPETSLVKLAKLGLLARELAPFNLLAKNFDHVYLFTFGRSGDDRFQNQLSPNIIIKRRPFPIPSRWHQYLAPFWYWQTVRQANVIRTNQIRGARLALIMKRLQPRAKLVIRTGFTQSLFDRQAGRDPAPAEMLERRAYLACDLALVTSRADRDYLIASYRLEPAKVQIIANYIDTNLFQPLPEKKYDRRLVFVGRAGDPQKNLSALLAALTGTGLTLDIIGKTKNTGSLEASAKKLNVPLNWLGIVPNLNLPALLNRYSVFVLPSLYEGMPKSLLEAMACGLSCVATDVPGSREVIQDNITGLLGLPTAASLREKILTLINNPDLRQKLGSAARQYVIANFSLSTQIKTEINLYQKIISQ